MKKRIGSIISTALFMLVIIVMSTSLISAAGTTLKITKQPASVKVLSGTKAEVSVSVSGVGLTYTWYDKDTDEKKFAKNTKFKSNTYSVKMSNSVNGRQVYCVIKDRSGKSVKTKTVTLKKGTKVKITKQPVSASALKNKKVKVTVTAKGDGLTYKWYYKDAGSSKYKYTKTYKGKTYTVKMNKSRNGRKVYCVVTDKYGNSVKTKAVTVTMGTAVKITTQPKSASASCGKEAKVTVKAKGDGLTYKWYYKDAGSSKYKYTKTFKGKTYTATMNKSRDGRMVYCVIKDKYGKSVKTKAVTLTTKHSLSSEVTKKATCTATGEKVYTCKNCSYKRTDIIDKVAHKMGSWTVYSAATVTENGVERSSCKNCSYYKDRTTDKLKAAYYITLNTGVGSATKVGVAADGAYTLSNPVRTGYNFVGWKTNKGEDFSSSGTYKGNITVNAVWELDGTDTLAELVERTDAGVEDILITANITVNEPLYISYKTKIYSDGDYTITRAADYAGDIFVVGRDRNGKTASVNHRKAELTLGGGQGTLTVDGNRDNLKISVLGSAVIISDSSILNIYDGVKIINNKKSGNDRIFDISTTSVESLERAGGAAVLNLNSTVNMYGGLIDNNTVNTEYTVVVNEDGTKTSKEINGCGGAVFNRGNFKMYGGTISNNEALRGGGVYSDRIVYFDAGTVTGNKATAFGGGFASSSSANADTFVGTENGSGVMVFSDNYCKGTGGALYSNTSSPIIIYGNARFENNSTDSSGGAIYTAGPLTIRNTEFIGNTSARSGGAIYHYYTKESFERRDLTITGSKFEKNSGNLGGAIILSASDSVSSTGLGTYATITDCQFDRNSAVMLDTSTGNGGAIYITRKSEATIENCSFTGNTSVSNAGAIAAQGGTKVKLTDITFTGNSAVTGGALYASGAAWLKMKNIEFRENSAVLSQSNSGGNGGAAYIYETESTFDNLDFYDNSAANHAGAVYLGVTDIKVDSTCDFVGNSAGKHGGAFYLTYKTKSDGTKDGAVLNATDVSFENNTAMAGGAISARTSCTANLKNVSLINNSVTGYDGTNNGDGEGGGAVYVGYGALSLDNVTATGNFSYSNGGAVNALKSDVTVKNATFTDNSSDSNGGALFVSSENAVETSDITFTGNTAANGGAMYVGSGTTIDMTNIAFNGNSAQTNGGGICVFSSNVTLNNVDMTGNTAGNHAGAFYLSATELNVDSTCDFVGNSAGKHGGVFYLTYKKTDNGNIGAVLNAVDVNFENNTAMAGGAISARTDCTANLNGVKLIGNSVSGYDDPEGKGETVNDGDSEGGGAIYVGFGSATLTDVTATGNTASDFGGVIDAVSSDVIVTGGTFSGNKTKSGGVIFARTKSDVSISGAVLSENESTYIQTGTYNGAIGGGAICADGGTLTIADTSLTSNKSGYYGGAVHTSGTTVDISGNTVISGSTGSTGAALYFRNSSKVTMNGTAVKDNTSKGNGVIYHNGGTLDITGLTATGNKGGNGGVFYISGGSTKATIKDSSFSGNNATTGGVLYMIDATVTVSGSEFKENTAKNGGVVYNRTGTYNSDGVSYSANTANGNGGVLSLAGGTVNTGAEDNFTSNSATGHGGAVYVSYYDKTVTVDNVESTERIPGVLNANGGTFTGNTALAGGAISVRSASVAELNGTDLIGNSVTGYADENDGDGEGGGAIYVGFGTVELTNVTATGNTASDFGGVIDSMSADVIVTGGTYSGNKTNSGGVIYARSKSDVSVSGAVLSENESTYVQTGTYNGAIGGGVICTDGGTLTIADTSLTSNKSGYYGGAVHTTGTTVDISGNTVVSGSTGSTGAALYFRGGSKVTMNGTTVKDNTSAGNGIIYQNGGTLDITGLAATGNKALNGGVFYISGGSTVVNIDDSSFSGNNATTGGVIYMIDATVTVNGSEFKENTAKSGGAVYNRTGTYNSDGASYSANTASGSGGAVLLAGGTANIGADDTFTSNTATENGGAIYVSYFENADTKEKKPATLNANGGIFTSNNAGINGGAVYIVGSDVTATGECEFRNNSAESHGGAVYVNYTGKGEALMPGVLNMTGGLFEGNTAIAGGAVSVRSNCTAELNGTEFIGNSVSGYYVDGEGKGENDGDGEGGGAIYVGYGTVNLTDVTATGNTASDFGGVIDSAGATVNVTGGTFSGNSTKKGGVIYAVNGSIVNFDGGTASKNIASAEGGFAVANNGKLDIKNTSISENEATGNGGAVYVYKTATTLDGAKFISNKSSGNGGAIDIAASEVTATGECEFKTNTAVGHGGAVYVTYTGKDDTLIGGVLNMTGGLFEGNTALAGGAISSRTGCNVSLTGTVLRNNTATSEKSSEGGGAIFTNNNTLTLSGVVMEGNSTGFYGGAVTSLGAKVTVKDKSQISNNTGATGLAFNLRDSGDDVSECTLTDISVTDNKATASGNGIIYITGKGTLSITGLTATGNENSNGGVIYASGSANVTVEDSVLSGNTALSNGGAIYVSDATVTVNDSEIKENTAKHGGAVYNLRGTYNSDGVSYSANTASGNGGVISLAGGTVNTGAEDTFTSNSATGHGGAVYVAYHDLKNADGSTTRMPGVLNANGGLFEDNTALAGGAISVRSASVAELNGTELIGNSVTGYADENDGDGEGGGAIYVGFGTVELTNVTATGNTASDFGGVIDSMSADVIVTGGTYSGNKTYSGGVIYARSSSDVSVSGAVLSENESTYVQTGTYNGAIGGGAICTDGGTLTIADTSLTSNKSGYYGGTIHTSGTTVDISGNTVISGSTGSTGAALYFRGGSKVTMNGTTVKDNTSAGNGVIYQNGGTLDITGLTATGNKALNGGVFFISGGSTVVNIKDSVYSGNNATTGGVIHMTNATVTVSGSEFKENTANNGGAVYNQQGIYNSDGTSYSTNTSSNHGGAVSLSGGTANIGADDTFTSNSATNHGGAVYVSYRDIENADSTTTRVPGVLIANGGTFTGNTALGGGAISVRSASVAELNGTELIGNSVTGYADKNDGDGEGGGAIYVGYGTLSLKDVTATGNTASDFGGAVDSVSSTVDIIGGTFSANSTKIGGALYIMNTSDVTIKNTRFENNIASSKGGAISTDTSSVTLAINAEGCIFEGNKATGDGAGAVEIQNGNCNSATDPTEVTIVFKDCSFIDNSANKTGGAVEIRTNSCAKFDGITATGNTAKANGGVIYVTSNYSRIYLTGDVVLSDNSTGETGEFIHLYNNNYSNPPKLYTTHSSSADWYTTDLVAGNRTNVAFDLATLP